MREWLEGLSLFLHYTITRMPQICNVRARINPVTLTIRPNSVFDCVGHYLVINKLSHSPVWYSNSNEMFMTHSNLYPLEAKLQSYVQLVNSC